MKKTILLIIFLLFITACQQQQQQQENETESAIVVDTHTPISRDDLFVSARWDSKIACNDRNIEGGQVYADIRITRKVDNNYLCEFRVGDKSYAKGVFEKGIVEDIYMGRANVFHNQTIELCCFSNGDETCVGYLLKNICQEGPKLIDRDVLVEDFTLVEDETKYFYFTARETGEYEIYVNTQCDFCNDNYVTMEILTLPQCRNKQNDKEYVTTFEIEHKRNLIAHLALPDMTELCVALSHDDDEDVNVSKHLRVHGSWYE